MDCILTMRPTSEHEIQFYLMNTCAPRLRIICRPLAAHALCDWAPSYEVRLQMFQCCLISTQHTSDSGGLRISDERRPAYITPMFYFWTNLCHWHIDVDRHLLQITFLLSFIFKIFIGLFVKVWL